MCDNRRFDIRRGGWCDERQATCDARATIDASTRDEKSSRSAKATICQNTASTTYPPGEKGVYQNRIVLELNFVLDSVRKKCGRTCEIDEFAMPQGRFPLPYRGNHPRPPPNKYNAYFGRCGLAIVNATFFIRSFPHEGR